MNGASKRDCGAIAILPRSWKFPSLSKEGWRAAPGWFASLIP